MSDATDDVAGLEDLVLREGRSDMATVSRSTVPASNGEARIIINKVEPLNIRLPQRPMEPVHDFARLRFLLTGDPGVGKTKLGLQEPTCLNLTFDPLRESYGGFQEYVPDWRHMLGYVELLEKAKAAGKLPYKRVQFDGVDIGFRHCQEFVCKALDVKHPNDAPYGKGWDMLNTAFSSVVDRLFALVPCGVWFTCHAKEKEIEKADGRKVTRLSPTLKGAADDIVVGKCDVVMNIWYVGSQMMRVGTIRGDESVSAKCDVDGHFLTKDGRQIQEIVLGNKGEKEAYKRLLAAYNNQQPYATYDEALEKTRARTAAAKPKETETTVVED